jgi:hypothetical protein
MQSDNLHPIPEGADYRAQLIARGIKGCLAFRSAPAPEPVLDSKPEMKPVGKLMKRQSSMVRAIAAEVAREVAAQVAQRAPSLAAALAMVSTRLGSDA